MVTETTKRRRVCQWSQVPDLVDEDGPDPEEYQLVQVRLVRKRRGGGVTGDFTFK